MEIVKARPDGPLLYAAVEALGKTGPAAVDAVPMLTELLTTVAAPPPPPTGKRSATNPLIVRPYVKLDAAALQALGTIGPRAASALPMLFELLKDGDSTVRNEAGRAISRIASGTERLPPLSEIIERCDTGTIANALRPFQTNGMEALLLEFDTPSAPLRLRVASVFANMQLANVCPYLAGALKNEDSHFRAGAALALSEIRRQYKGRNLNANAAPANSDQVLAALKDAVKDSDPDVRVLAAYAFMRAIDAESPELVERVATGLAACSMEFRPRGMTALDYYNLEKTGRKAAAALPVLIRCAAQDMSGPPAPRTLISRIGLTKDDVPVLVEALKEKNAATRKMVCRLIEGLGPNAKDAVPALIDTLGDDERLKIKGLEAALVAIGPEAIAHTVAALKDTNPKRRAGAAQALTQMNLDGAWLTQLAVLLGDERAEVRASTLSVFATSKERAAYALPRVRELLLDEDKYVTRYSQELFSLLGPAATPALIEALKDTRPQVRIRAARAIRPRKSDPAAEAFQPLLNLLNDDSPEVKAAALQTLDYYTAQAAEVVARLGAVMKDESPVARRGALQYLRHHGAAAPQVALEALTPAFKDPQPGTRVDAIEALTHLGEHAAGAAELLFTAISDPEHRVRAAAAEAIQTLGLANDPDKLMLIDEMFAIDTVEQYAQAQEEFFIRTWDDNKVHYYALSLKSLIALPAAVMAADANVTPPPAQPYNGYLFKMLEGQSATAPGGAKKYIVDGKMSQGHAFAAYPAEYGKTGKTTFIVGDDGTIYKKDLGPDTPRLSAEMRELNPDDTWTRLKVKPKDEGPLKFHPLEKGAEEMEF
jgi:HEAT repeat protein